MASLLYATCPRNQLANAVTSWLEREKIGFQPTDVETRGKYLVSVLTDVFWIIDGHSQTLAHRSCAVPTEFSSFNVSEAYKHKRKTLERTAVEISAHKLF